MESIGTRARASNVVQEAQYWRLFYTFLTTQFLRRRKDYLPYLSKFYTVRSHYIVMGQSVISHLWVPAAQITSTHQQSDIVHHKILISHEAWWLPRVRSATNTLEVLTPIWLFQRYQSDSAQSLCRDKENNKDGPHDNPTDERAVTYRISHNNM